MSPEYASRTRVRRTFAESDFAALMPALTAAAAFVKRSWRRLKDSLAGFGLKARPPAGFGAARSRMRDDVSTGVTALVLVLAPRAGGSCS